MKLLTVSLIIWLMIITMPAAGQGTDYTSRNYTTPSCELFANDAYQAADNLDHGVELQDILELIDSAPVPDSEKYRAFQAIQFVWKNQLDNPVLAYTLAMGLCLKPKQEMAPIDEPWLVSPRTNKEHF